MSDKTETTALATIGPTNMAELKAFAIDAHKANFFGAKSPEQALLISMTGKDLGLSYTQALRAFHVTQQGKLTMSADGMMAVVLGHPNICEYFITVETTTQKATVETKRRGSPQASKLTYTWEDAARAGLTGKDTWKSHPAAMLRAAAKRSLARDVYPDLLMGLYESDEVEPSRDRADRPEATYDRSGERLAGAPEAGKTEAIDAEFTDSPKPTPEDLLAEHGVTVPMFDAWRESQKKGGWATLDDGQKALISQRLAQPADKDVVRRSYDAFVKAYQEFSDNEEPAPEPPKEDPKPPKEGHDPSFTEKARKAFMAGLSGLTPPLKYEDLARFTEATGRGRPSSWDEKRRVEVFLHLRDGGGNAEVQEWLAGNPKEGK